MAEYNWYIVQVHSGFENKVANALKEKSLKENCNELFEQIVVPVHNLEEVKKGKKVKVEKKIFPGYIIVRMQLNDLSWQMVKSINKVTGFLGYNGKPSPISNKEAESIIESLQEGFDKFDQKLTFEVGETVKVIDGAFESFTGVVNDVDYEKEKLKVSVVIFSRSTPVELDFTQVEQLDKK